MNIRTPRRTFLSLLIPSLLSAEQDFAVITQTENPNSISSSQIKRIILGQEAHWPGGGKIILLLGPSGDPARIAAIKKFAGISEADLYKIIMHLNFTGHGDLAPLSFASATSVVQAVKAKPGSVGIVPASALNPSVRKIDVD
jgi:hypothetical protein